MARPQKTGLDYFSTDTDKYNDIRIKKLKRVYGCEGVAVYDYLLCEVYRVKGCYLDWDEEICLDIAEYFKIEEKAVEQIVNFCCEVKLFDRGLFEKVSVLTSRSIQKRYLGIIKTIKRKNSDIPKNILLSTSFLQNNPEETPPKREETRGKTEETPRIKEETLGKREESTQSKVKESKEKKKKEEEAPPATTELTEETVLDELRNSEKWLADMSINYNVSRVRIIELLDEFKRHRSTSFKSFSGLKEYVDHFKSWLLKRNPNENKTKKSAYWYL